MKKNKFKIGDIVVYKFGNKESIDRIISFSDILNSDEEENPILEKSGETAPMWLRLANEREKEEFLKQAPPMKTITKEEAIQIINDSPSSIFSQQDVINLINSIKEPEPINIEELINNIMDDIDNISPDDLVDYDSAEFSFYNGNEVQLEDIETQSGNIRETIEEAVKTFFDVR